MLKDDVTNNEESEQEEGKQRTLNGAAKSS